LKQIVFERNRHGQVWGAISVEADEVEQTPKPMSGKEFGQQIVDIVKGYLSKQLSERDQRMKVLEEDRESQHADLIGVLMERVRILEEQQNVS
jgi:hypothetical protein